MILTLYTENVFNAAHRLMDYQGQCAELHGHSWKVGLWVRGSEELLKPNGILWDFSNLKVLTDKLDHKYLNDVIDVNPTCENITIFLYKCCKEADPQLEFKVRVWENAVNKNSFCETGDFT